MAKPPSHRPPTGTRISGRLPGVHVAGGAARVNFSRLGGKRLRTAAIPDARKNYHAVCIAIDVCWFFESYKSFIIDVIHCPSGQLHDERRVL